MRHRESMIMFENDKGAHPNIWAMSFFIALITAMIFNLYNFHIF